MGPAAKAATLSRLGPLPRQERFAQTAIVDFHHHGLNHGTKTPPIMLHLCYSSVIPGIQADCSDFLILYSTATYSLPKPGLEPGRGYPPGDFKSPASTNSATPAWAQYSRGGENESRPEVFRPARTYNRRAGE